MKERRIFKSRTTRQYEVKDLLRSLLVAEIIQPSHNFWLVSPWLTDMEILDNRTGAYDYLNAGWGQRKVQFTELLCCALLNGAITQIVTSKSAHNDRFLRNMIERAGADGTEANVHIAQHQKLHTKGLLGRNFYLHGSMNFTIGGIEINDEQINLTTDKTAVVDAELAFRALYGALLGIRK